MEKKKLTNSELLALDRLLMLLGVGSYSLTQMTEHDAEYKALEKVLENEEIT